jgi:hypothetical protein
VSAFFGDDPQRAKGAEEPLSTNETKMSWLGPPVTLANRCRGLYATDRAVPGVSHQVEPDPAEMAAQVRRPTRTTVLDWCEKARIFSLQQPGREWYDAELCRFDASRQSHDAAWLLSWTSPCYLAGSIAGPAFL